MKNKNFIIMALGQVISILGSAIQRCSLSLYILDMTGSAGIFSTALAISMVPYVLFAPVAGVWADTVDRKYSMVLFDFISGGITVFYAFMLFTGRDSIPLVIGIMTALSLLAALYNPVVTASIPAIVEKESLVRANGIIQQIGSASNFLGPLLGGILYGVFGIKIVIAMNGISFIFSAVMEMFLTMKHQKQEGKLLKKLACSYQEMLGTFRYLQKEARIVLSIILTFSLYNFFISPVLTVLFPYVIKTVFGLSAQTYGWAEGVLAAGMMGGGLVVTVWPKAFSIKKVWRVLYPLSISLGAAGGLFLMMDNKYFLTGACVLSLAVVMASLGSSNVVLLSYIQEKVKDGMLGKVSAFSTAMATLCTPVGQLIFGRALEIEAPVWSLFMLAGVVSFGVTVFISNQIRKMRV